MAKVGPELLLDEVQDLIAIDIFSAYPVSGMITVPVNAGNYQAIVASIQQGGGLTFHGGDQLAGGGAIQIVGANLQLPSGQVSFK